MYVVRGSTGLFYQIIKFVSVMSVSGFDVCVPPVLGLLNLYFIHLYFRLYMFVTEPDALE